MKRTAAMKTSLPNKTTGVTGHIQEKIAGMPASPPRLGDASMNALRNMPNPPQAVIYEPALEHDSFGQTQGVSIVYSALVQYLTGWFGFPTLQNWNFDCPAQILIVDEIHLHTLLAQQPGFIDNLSMQSIIILCANPARQAMLSKDIQSGQVELICKPVGPHKLARAIHRALQKQPKQPDRQLSQANSDMSVSARKAKECGKITGGESAMQLGPVSLGVTHDKEVSASGDGGFPFPADQGTSSHHTGVKNGDSRRDQERPALLNPPTRSESVSKSRIESWPHRSSGSSVPDTNGKVISA